MVSSADILNLGWDKFSTLTNGGTKKFSKFTKLGVFLLTSSADNFNYRKNNDPKLKEITIEEVFVNMINGKPDFDSKRLYQGSPENKEELKLIIAKLPIELKDYRREKLRKINENT